MSISKNLLRTAFVFALAVAGCDDDEPLNPADGGARDTATTVDTNRDMAQAIDTPRVDATADGGADRPADTAGDAAVDRADTSGDVIPNLDVSGDSSDARVDGADGGDAGDGSAGG
jgi:hypothetical protein